MSYLMRRSLMLLVVDFSDDKVKILNTDTGV